MTPPPYSRALYPTLDEVVYLNQASLGLIGQPVVDAMIDFLEDVGRHGNTHMSDEEEAGFLARLRSVAAQMLRADADQIAILASASELLGQIPLILDLEGRTRVIAVSSDFPAVTRPWLRLAEKGHCVVEFVDDAPGSDLTADVIARIDGNTAVVTVGSVQYATGTVVDIPLLRTATADAGARLVVDATQEAGARETPMGSWNADVAVTSGYKWLGGHGGVAIAVIGRALLQETPAMPGWMSAPNPFDFDAKSLPLAKDARRYTQSTISYVSAAGLAATLNQQLDVGLGPIEQHARHVARSLIEQTRPLGWEPMRPLNDPAASAHIVSLRRPDTDITPILSRLRSLGIVAGGRGGGLRVSIAPYNDEEDISALARSLSQIQ